MLALKHSQAVNQCICTMFTDTLVYSVLCLAICCARGCC